MYLYSDEGRHALSVLQPWAALIVTGEKIIETRTRRTLYRGLLLIHASARMTKSQKELCKQEPFASSLTAWRGMFGDDYKCGQIIGEAQLVDVRPTEYWRDTPILATKEFAFGDYQPKRFGWRLDMPILYPKPIPAKGRLGIWRYKEPVA